MKFRLIFKYYWQFLIQYKYSQLVLFSSYTFGKTVDVVAVPVIYKVIVDTVSAPPTEPAEILLRLFLYLVAAHIFMNIVFRVGDYYMIRSNSGIQRDLSDFALKKLQQHSYTFFTNSFSGGLIAKSKRFVAAFDILHSQFVFTIWFGAISLLSSMVVLFYFSPVLGLAFFVWLMSYIVLVIFLVRWQIPKSLANATADTKTTAHYSDTISNFFTVMMFGTRKREELAFAKVTNEQERLRRRAWMQENFWSSMFQGVNISGFNLIFIGIALWLWLQGEITAGTVVLVQIYVITSFDVVWHISQNIVQMSSAMTNAQEMVEIFEQDVEVKDPLDPEPVRIKSGLIEFNNVHFAYENNNKVFTDLNLKISAGEKVALVGHSGAGKTTITKLLLRFVDIDQGIIAIDGQNIKAVLQDDLRKHIAYVPQEPILFHRSLRENIAYGKPNASDKEVEMVAKKAHCHDFINALPDKYDTLVGERGVKLSGGERQRVAIARAMLKDAPIIMLDEATSALDSESEEKIQAAFSELMEGKTTIVIAHRLSTIQRMDRIIVFEAGQIAEEGTHNNLKEQEGIYARLWNSQVGGFISD